MTVSSEMKKRMEDVEFQMESVLEQLSRLERLMQNIQGGLTAMKWLAAVLGVILAIWEII